MKKISKNEPTLRFLLNCSYKLLNESGAGRMRQKLGEFLRFGDPRGVEGGKSKILDPHVVAREMGYEELVWDPDGPPIQQFEKGISAYPVIRHEGEKIVFYAPIGIPEFKRQVSGFLWERLKSGEVYIFLGRSTGYYGTDDEPLVDSSSIRRVRKVSSRDIFVTDAHYKIELCIYDLVTPHTIGWDYDMGYSDFFNAWWPKVDENDVNSHFDELLRIFKTPDQIKKIESIRHMWLQEMQDDKNEK